MQEAWEMNDESKIEQATIAKEKGTTRLKSKHYTLAIQHYQRVVALLDHQEAKVNIPSPIFKIIYILGWFGQVR